MWFSSYLQDRKQFVTIDGHKSNVHKVCGVQIIVAGQNIRFMSIKINKDLDPKSMFIDNKLTLNV